MLGGAIAKAPESEGPPGAGGRPAIPTGARRLIRPWMSRHWPMLGIAATAAILTLASVFAAPWSGSSPSRPGRDLTGLPSAAEQPSSISTTAPSSTTTTIAPPPSDLALAGCPPPPPSTTPPPAPWHPSVLVPASQLPAPFPAPARLASLAAIAGKGMWIWQFADTAGGDPAAIVAAAQRAGLHQLWVRVADSQNGFYGADILDQLVPLAHRNGIEVIGWGFPYLYDPVGDANWTVEGLDWTFHGSHLDGFSPDIETASEGVDLTAQRVQVYLSLVRHERPGALLVATVFPPTDHEWATYPYQSIAPYVDAFAPMVYWGCEQPVLAAGQALSRLGTLAPVHLIGQAYNMAAEGGRTAPPSPAEINAFLLAARQDGALGASFWSWQAIDPDEWSAMASFSW